MKKRDRSFLDNRQPPTASVYVPIESYVYALFDRLAGMGVVDTAFVGIRPWTRAQCARLVEEAEDRVGDEPSGVAASTLVALEKEFAPELTGRDGGLTLDELYLRSLTISGQPIEDFHFGQTTINDYGRPDRGGSNGVVGFIASEVHGPTVFHLRGEFQHAPASNPLSADVQTFINTVDETPGAFHLPSTAVNRFRLVEAYAGLHLKDINITAGKQTLWWGPSADTATLYTNNSEPIYMVRVQQDAPIKLPLFFKYLGPMRWDAFFGRLYGHHHPAGPYIHGQKLTFKPTRNIEFGFSRTVEFAGEGHPLTLGSFWKSFISVGDNPSATPGTSRDVGDRRGGFDFSYRLPRLRQYVTLYGDFFTDDDPSPLSAFPRSGLIPGIYVSHLPFLPKAELRVEALVTDQAAVDQKHGRFFYFNEGYKDGYTNGGNLIGSWIGRDSKAILATTRYWFTGTTDLSITYRQVKLAAGYVPGGGTQHNARLEFRSPLGHEFCTTSFIQYEQWKIPFLNSSLQRNVSVGIEFSFFPSLVRHKQP